MTFDPDKYLNKRAGFDPDAYLENKREPEAFGVGEAVRNFTQGGSLGFSDELAGLFEAGGSAFGVQGLGGPIEDISLSEDGPNLDFDKITSAYARGRDKERGDLAADKANSPTASLLTQLAGGVMSPVNKIKALQQLSAAKSGAVLGATQGAGSSEADNLGDFAIDTGLGLGLGAGTGKAIEKAGQYLGKGLAAPAKFISPPKQKANTPEILEAAKKLGLKVTPGMLDDSGFVERLESMLAKSPSFLGQSVKRNQDEVYSGMVEAGEALTKDASSLSPFQMGDKFKAGITANIGERLDPLAAVFDEVASLTKHVPIGQKSISAITRNIGNDDLYSLGVGSATAQKYVDALPKLKNANQVKSLMTALNEDLRSAQGSDKQVLGMIKDKLARLESSSIIRAAIQSAKETGSGPGSMKAATGEKLGRDIVGDLLDARKGYAGLAQDVGSVAKEARLNAKGPHQFLNAVEAIPSERIQDKFFNAENVRQLQNLQEKFPEQFALLRQGKLKDVFDSSIDNSLNGQGKFAVNKFLKSVRELNPEAQKMLFGEGVGTIGNMQTIQNAMPRNFNPSGTASEIGWQDAVYRNVRDIPTYMMYKGASTNLGREISSGLKEGLLKSPQMLDFSKRSPLGFQQLLQRLENQGSQIQVPRAADQQQQKPEANKDPVDKKKIIEKAQGSKYGQVLQNAAERGDTAFGAAHYILSQRDPEFRKQMQEEEV